MNTDKEYFEKFFAICELLVEKEHLVERLWDSDKDGLLSETHYRSRKNLATINSMILDEEECLRKEVHNAYAAGREFVFEAFARKHGLTPFEKRVVLYFLHMDLYGIGHVAVSRRHLAAIIDCESTPVSRSNTLLDLFPGSRLSRKKIIATVLGDSEVRLAVPVRDKLRKLVSGRKGRIPSQEDDSDCSDEVGRICAPEYKLKDVFLTPDKMREVLLHVETHGQMAKLGGMKGLRRGKGLGMLFYGPPGTGKSMFAHAIADSIGKKILQVNVSQVKSKWVGQSEKNIVRVFQLARERHCVVCLDEADSLIHSREGALRSWELSQANVFLEEVEKFDGILILTTNMENRLDPALERRLAIRVLFDVPSADVRQKIWASHVPRTVQCSETIDWALLGEQYPYAGGYIKNAVLGALRHMLARRSDILCMDDLLFGARTEQSGRFIKENKGPIGFSART